MRRRALFAAGLASLLVVLPLLSTRSAGAGAGSCPDAAKASVTACLQRGQAAYANAALGQGDFAFMGACQAQYTKDLAQCGAPAGGSNGGACAEAKIDIAWVLQGDAGARATFQGGLQNGMSPLDAVIWAQHHDPHAQDVIRQCPSSVGLIASMLGLSAGAVRQAGQAPRSNPQGPAYSPIPASAEADSDTPQSDDDASATPAPIDLYGAAAGYTQEDACHDATQRSLHAAWAAGTPRYSDECTCNQSDDDIWHCSTWTHD